jgi:hypothetical protein
MAQDPGTDKGQGQSGWPDSGLYSTLVSFYIYQDQLMFSRIELIIVVQGAVFVAGYGFRSGWLGPVIMAFGVLFTCAIGLLIGKDIRDRDVNVKLMVKLSSDLVPSNVAEDIKDPGENKPTQKEIKDSENFWKNVPIQMGTSRWPAWAKGRYVIFGALAFFIIVDLVCGVLYAVCPSMFPTPQW